MINISNDSLDKISIFCGVKKEIRKNKKTLYFIILLIFIQMIVFFYININNAHTNNETNLHQVDSNLLIEQQKTLIRNEIAPLSPLFSSSLNTELKQIEHLDASVNSIIDNFTRAIPGILASLWALLYLSKHLPKPSEEAINKKTTPPSSTSEKNTSKNNQIKKNKQFYITIIYCNFYLPCLFSVLIISYYAIEWLSSLFFSFQNPNPITFNFYYYSNMFFIDYCKIILMGTLSFPFFSIIYLLSAKFNRPILISFVAAYLIQAVFFFIKDDGFIYQLISFLINSPIDILMTPSPLQYISTNRLNFIAIIIIGILCCYAHSKTVQKAIQP